jgi:hypothetical protein
VNLAPRACLVGLLAWGCKMETADFQRAPSLTPVVLGGPTPPPVAYPEGEKLYQLLYAGEFGSRTNAKGQHARMLAWLAAMDLSESQLDQLVSLLDQLDAARERQAALRAEQDEHELAALGPIYNEISDAYSAGGTPDEAALAAWAAQLEAARATLYGDDDPRTVEMDRVRALMGPLEFWLQSLTEAQRHDLAQCRFFLRKRLGPLLNPGDYGDLTGISWDGGDFRGVNTTFPDTDEHHMDIGGLWSTEFMRAPPNLYLDRLQLRALLLIALKEEGLREAIVARRLDAPALPSAARPSAGTPATDEPPPAPAPNE